MAALNLKSCWENNEDAITFQRKGTDFRSQIDYILTRFGSLISSHIIVDSSTHIDWTFVDSDHALS